MASSRREIRRSTRCVCCCAVRARPVAPLRRRRGCPTGREPQTRRFSARRRLHRRPGRHPHREATPRLERRPARDASPERCGQTSSIRQPAAREPSPAARRWRRSSHRRRHAAQVQQRERWPRQCRHPGVNDGTAGVRALLPPRRARSTDFGRSWSSKGFCRVTGPRPRGQPRERSRGNAHSSRVGLTQRRQPALGRRCSGHRTDGARPLARRSPAGPTIVEALRGHGPSIR